MISCALRCLRKEPGKFEVRMVSHPHKTVEG